MKLLGKIVAGVIICLMLVLVVLRITGLDPIGPKKVGDNWNAHMLPGLWLRGKVETASPPDWSFTDDIPTVMVQTRTWFGLPMSVIVAVDVYNNHLYFVSAYPAGHGEHLWNRNVARDAHVRINVAGKLYDRDLFEVIDPVERAGVLASRWKKYGPEHPLYFHPPRSFDPYSIVKVYRVMEAGDVEYLTKDKQWGK